MAYIPPSYEELHLATAALLRVSNKTYGRYRAPEFSELRATSLDMKETYLELVAAKSYLRMGAKPGLPRLEEINCIRHLIERLPETLPGSRERNQVHNTLLGALFYRRMAIGSSYSGSWASFFGFNSENSSALYLAIQKVLNIKPDNLPDDLTVYTCCRAYYDHVDREKRLGNESGYIRTGEVDFFEQLKAIITKVETPSKLVDNQIRQLIAIQSIASLLRKTDAEVDAGIEVLSESLLNALGNKSSLSRGEIVKCLRAAKLSPLVATMIEQLVDIKQDVTKASCRNFIEDLKQKRIENSQYTLLGAYVIVLKEAPIEQADLTKLTTILASAIGATSLSNSLDDETRFKALSTFAAYLKLPSMGDLDFSAWGSYDSLQADVDKRVADTQSIIELVMSASCTT